MSVAPPASHAFDANGGLSAFWVSGILNRGATLVDAEQQAGRYAPDAIPALFIACYLAAAAESMIGRPWDDDERREFLAGVWHVAQEIGPAYRHPRFGHEMTAAFKRMLMNRDAVAPDYPPCGQPAAMPES